MIRNRFRRKSIYRVPVVYVRGSSKKERRVIKLVASLDHFVVRLVIALIVLYILMYGYFVSHGFNFGHPSWKYAFALIPLWLVDGLKGLIENFIPSDYKNSSEDLTQVTVIVPSYNGGEALSRTLEDLTQRFPPFNIIVASNGSTDNTVAITQVYGVRCVVAKSPVGKVRAINYALERVETRYVMLVDDDTIIGNAKIPTGLLEEGFEAVAFRILVNVSTWITKIQMYEYRKSTDIGKRYHNRNASVQNVSGAVGLFNAHELRRQIRYHTHEFAGEDLQRTLLVHLAKDSKGVVLADSTVYTDPPTRLKGLFNQRTLGWFPGLYVNFPNYVKLIFKKNIPWALRYDAFYNAFLVILMDILRLFSLPTILFYPWYFAIMYAAYVLLETISYIKLNSKDPYWVVLVYPIYGIFGFITRICAMCVFFYRRIVAVVARTVYFDDYKHASKTTKSVTIILIMIIVESALLLSIQMESSVLTNGLAP